MAIIRVITGQRAADFGDLVVTQIDQVLGCQPRTLRLIVNDRREINAQLGPDLDEGNTMCQLDQGVVIIYSRDQGNQDQSISETGIGAFEGAGELSIVDSGDDEMVTEFVRRAGHVIQNAVETEIGQHDLNRVGSFGLEDLRGAVRMEVQCINRFENALARWSRNVLVVIDYARNRLV